MQVLVSLVSASKMDGDPPQDSTSTEAIPVLPAKLEKHFERHGLTAYHSQSYHITAAKPKLTPRCLTAQGAVAALSVWRSVLCLSKVIALDAVRTKQDRTSLSLDLGKGVNHCQLHASGWNRLCSDCLGLVKSFEGI